MRVLFAAWAWPTHLFPMVPLAWALRSAGHQVLVASQPALLPAIARAGLPGVVVGADAASPAEVAATVRRAGGRGRRLGTSVLMAESMVDGLLALARRWGPDLIVYEPTTYAGPLVAAKLGIPAVRHLWGMDIHHHARPYEVEAFAPLCERLGIDGFRPGGDATIDPCPPSLQLAGADRRIDMRYVAFNGSGPMPRWLAEPRHTRRICVTWGVSQSWRSRGERIRDLTGALAGLGAEVVLAIAPRDRAAIGALPGSVRVAEMLPIHLVLPSCDLFVSGGGNGSILTAVDHGTPQLCVVTQHTERESAQALARTGAGLCLEEEQADRVREAARRILDDPAFAAAARDLRAESHARPLPARVVPVLGGELR